MSLPNCPKCDAEYTYEDGALLVCPMCAHEWTAAETDAAQAEEQDAVIRDAVGNELQDGDAVTVIKDLKVKGSSMVAKQGTAVRRISLDRENAEFIEGKVGPTQIVIITKYVKKI